MPYEQNQATYQVGLLSDNQDDKGNYIYGNKEIWYTHSIESKTMVAQFILSDRQDGLGVLGVNGGQDASQKLKCLTEIDLYSKADLMKNGYKAVPIKSVHFVYSYSLCPGTPNSTGTNNAKLTLTKVYFTYGNNTEGALNSYQFTYSSFNPSFNHNAYDKWGYYKYNSSGMPTNMDWPYSTQDSNRANLFATAWNLTGIHLPSGGQITVKYESNDYAYVQNQRAGQMFQVAGMNNDGSATTQTWLYGSDGTPYRYIILNLATTSKQDFYNRYLAGVTNLYFRFLINLDNANHYEYVPGYTTIAGYDRIDASHVYIKVPWYSTGDLHLPFANPMAEAAWQFTRLNTPQYAYPGSQTSGGVLGIIEALAGIMYDVLDIFQGFDARVESESYAQNFIPANSWVRLNNPTYRKFGGGTRVKEIDISDNWASMASSQKSFTYGQTFSYKTTIAGGQVISSGVATYEPLVGGDENPLRQPLPYSQKYTLAPNNNFYTETPLGESLFPSPGIVYSKVTVRSLHYNGIERTATGYTVNEYYTAYDFPTTATYSDMQVERIKPSVLSSIFSIGVQDYNNVSQGFCVETNDMPGKQKGQETYDENGAIISSSHYYYQVDNANSPSMHLNNDVKVIAANGNIHTASVGKDIDTWEDMREQDSQTQGFGATANNEFFVFPFIAVPVDIPVIFPDYSSDHSRFRSGVTTKYVYRSGIIDSVVNMQNGSTVTTKNLLFDGETGGVLLTQSNNEFDKPVYNFTYPAHWGYDGMGGEYQNIGGMLYVTTDGTGKITSPATPANYFAPGDEIEFYSGNVINPTKLWVTQPNSNWMLIDKNGSTYPLTSSTLVKIIRSGRRNMSSTPIGTLTTLNSPISGSSISVSASTNVVQAGGTLFSNTWKIPYSIVESQICNPLPSPTDTCLAKFIDSVIVNHKLFVQPSDSIRWRKYTPPGEPCYNFPNSLFYSLTPRTGMDQSANYTAQFGNCTINISSYSGQPVYLDSLHIFRRIPATAWPQIDDTTGGCINMYYLRTSSTYRRYILEAKLCINCSSCHDTCSNLAIGQPFNPYTQGMMGDWRPERNYIYYDSLRSPVYTASTSNIWSNGIFRNFTKLWDPPVTGTVWPLDTADKNWTWTSRISMYNPKGNEIEDVDALNRYSGALYGYIKSLPVAVSSNAKYKEIAFDGFEDYGFVNNCGIVCDNDHFSFKSNLSYGSADTTSSVAHTGRYSMQINAGHSIAVSRNIFYFGNKLDSISAANQFLLLSGGTIPQFSPDSGTYLFSAWVKENASCGQTGYAKDTAVITYSGSSVKSTFRPAGPVIEGWQRFEGRFKVPKTATLITLTLYAGGVNTAYYDDIRMEPFAAEMKSYVYDPFSLRLMATLDENNYATFYEYNDEGILMRVKKETERGIMTIKESRSSYPR